MKKITTIALFFILCLLVGCQATPEKPTITGSVVILYENQEIISENVLTTGETAEDVLLEVCQNHKIPYRLDNHMFDGFGGFDSTDTDGWILYVNDEIADKGAYEMKLENGFRITFEYVNYNEVFFAE